MKAAVSRKSEVEEMIVVNGVNAASFLEEAHHLVASYLSQLEQKDLSMDSCISMVIFVSDIANQEQILERMPFFQDLRSMNCAISIVGAAPVGNRISLIAHHAEETGLFKKLIRIEENLNGAQILRLVRKDRELHILFNFKGRPSDDVEGQTSSVFERLFAYCKCMNLDPKKLVRTWIYVNDIDNNYAGMVEARKSFFHAHGLSPDCGYPASTGIGGRSRDHRLSVLVNAHIYDNQTQVERIQALTHMNPTIEYGVTFERAMQVELDQGRYVYISGTASIDNEGCIVCELDLEGQVNRTVENIAALLESCEMRLEDLMYVCIYLRDFNEEHRTRSCIQKLLPGNVPFVLLHAPVCRPGWLIEIDGLARKTSL